MSENTGDGILIADLEKNATERTRVQLVTYNGRHLVDARVFTTYKSSGQIGPTKKGISVRVDQLPALIAALTEAHSRAAALGWTGDGAGGR